MGTLAVLIYSLSPTRKSIANAFFSNSFSAKTGEGIFYNHALFKKYYKVRITKLISFIYLLIGFILQIFAQRVDYEPIIISCDVVFLCIILFAVLHLISKIVVNKYGSKEVTSEELDNYSLETNVESPTDEEVIEMFEDRRK